MKKLGLLILPFLALILELLPYGAVLNFANPEGEPFRETFSYFSLIPFGYANFGPFISAILTCVLIIFVFYYIVSKKGLKIIQYLSFFAASFSVLPLYLGFSYFSIIALFITLFLASEYAIICIIKQGDKKER